MAGLTAGSLSAEATFECDYFLLKAEGLPEITVEPPAIPPKPPVISNLKPAENVPFAPADQGITFTVTSEANKVHQEDIQVTLNGEDRSGDLEVTGSSGNRDVRLTGLMQNQSFKAKIVVQDSQGLMSSKRFRFATFNRENFIFEAEDFNFGDGKFIDDPVLSAKLGGEPNSYFDKIGVPKVDEFDINKSGDHFYRFSSDPNALESDEAVGTSPTGDFLRQKFREAKEKDSNIDDFDVTAVVAGEWLNYTRTYPEGNFQVFVRAMSQPFQARLDLVTSDPTQPEQQTLPVGKFRLEESPNGNPYQFLPLTDPFGNEVVLDFPGEVRTLRVTALSSGFRPNFYTLVPADPDTAAQPYLSTVKPTPGAKSVTRRPTIKAVLVENGTEIAQESLKITLNGDELTSEADLSDLTAGIEMLLSPKQLLKAEAAHKVVVSFARESGPDQRVRRQWEFMTGNFPSLAKGDKQPSEIGSQVNGFQDDFKGTRDTGWVPRGPGGDVYTQEGGRLKVESANGNPNHLLYEGSEYNQSKQEILARIRVNEFGTTDLARAGVGVGVSSSNSQGINLFFRDFDQDGVEGRQFKLLDDNRAWGPPGVDIDWKNDSWYWLRLRQDNSTPSDGNNIHAKVWRANGTEAEPEEWEMNWSREGRTGFAGITASSNGGLANFEVDYVLIKAEGLPEITVESPLVMPSDKAQPTVQIQREDDKVILTWSTDATLQSAISLEGPWQNLPDATSPHRVTIKGSQKYFRLVQ